MGRLRTNTSVNTSVSVRQRISLVKSVVAGTLIFTLLGAGIFTYLNLANTEDVAAGNREKHKSTNTHRAYLENISLLDLSHLSMGEMDLLTNRDFVNDTTTKEYTSVKWSMNSSLSHLTLEVSNTQYEFSLELYDHSGSRIIYFENLNTDKVFVDKIELLPNHEYSYVLKNSAGEIYAGNLTFN